MFWEKLCKSNWNCTWASAPDMEPCVSCFYLSYCIEYVWKSSLWIGIFQRATQRPKCYWPRIYRAGAAVVSTITRTSANIIASHAGVFRGARFSPIPREVWNTCSPKNACVGGYQYHFSILIWYCEPGSLRKHPFLLALRRWGRFARNVLSGEERGETDVFEGYEREGAVTLGSRVASYLTTATAAKTFFKLCRAYSNSPKMLNVGEFPWSWFLENRTQVWKRKKNSSSPVYVLHKTWN